MAELDAIKARAISGHIFPDGTMDTGAVLYRFLGLRRAVTWITSDRS